MAKHIHADSMLQYAKDAMKTDEPWKLWEIMFGENDYWEDCLAHPTWIMPAKYRRKPKMISVTLANGEVVSWPEPHKGDLNVGQHCYLVAHNGGVEHVCFAIHSPNKQEVRFGMVHLTKDAADQHSYALFKINNQVAK